MSFTPQLLSVAKGGSGARTFTTNGILFGNGTSAFGVTAAGTAGQALVSNGAGSPPTFQGVGSVTSIGITPPAAGIGVSGSPVTGSGSITLSLTNDLLGLEGIAGTGFAVRTATDTWTQRSIQGTADQITVNNGAGAAGNPTILLADNPIVPGTGSITITTGTNAQRPGSPTDGMFRFNTTFSLLEYYDSSISQWVQIPSSVAPGSVRGARFNFDFSDLAFASTTGDYTLLTGLTRTQIISASLETLTSPDSVSTLQLSAGFFTFGDVVPAYDAIPVPGAETNTNVQRYWPPSRDIDIHAVSTGANLNTMTQGAWSLNILYVTY